MKYIEVTAAKEYANTVMADPILKAAVNSILDNAPGADAVEVVRCKDCKHWHEETGWCNHHSHFIGDKGEACHPWESNDWKMLNHDDFCSYGERKDNGK